MKLAINLAALAALSLLSFASAAHAQTLTLDAPITGITHDGGFFVRDSLTITPTTYQVDLSQYTAFSFHYSAPAGQQVVINSPNPLTFVTDSYLAQNPDTPYTGASATVAVTFDNLQGSVGSFDGFVSVAANNGFDIQYFASISSPVSFTGYTVTVSGLSGLPSGLATYTNGTYGINSYYIGSFSGGDPGSFTTLQAIPAAATPEPGSVALLVGMGVTGVGVLRRRRK